MAAGEHSQPLQYRRLDLRAKANCIDRHTGFVCRIDRIVDGQCAVGILAVGEDDKCLAAARPVSQQPDPLIDGVVECRIPCGRQGFHRGDGRLFVAIQLDMGLDLGVE